VAVAEGDLRRWRAQAAAEGEHPLRERVAHAVGVGVLRALPHAVWAGMDGLAREGIAMQQKAEVPIIEPRVVAQQVAGETPHPLVELVQQVLAFDTYLLDHLLIEVVEEFLARVALALDNLRLQLALELV